MTWDWSSGNSRAFRTSDSNFASRVFARIANSRLPSRVIIRLVCSTTCGSALGMITSIRLVPSGRTVSSLLPPGLARLLIAVAIWDMTSGVNSLPCCCRSFSSTSSIRFAPPARSIPSLMPEKIVSRSPSSVSTTTSRTGFLDLESSSVFSAGNPGMCLARPSLVTRVFDSVNFRRLVNLANSGSPSLVIAVPDRSRVSSSS